MTGLTSGKLLVTKDKEPWVDAQGNRFSEPGPGRAGIPRIEYFVMPNRVLKAFRQELKPDEKNGAGYAPVIAAEWLDFQSGEILHYARSWEEIDHSRKVLARIAALNERTQS